MSKDYPCIYWDKGLCKLHTGGEITSWCVEGPCPDQTLSNADRIRAMTDEELAKYLGTIGWDCHFCEEHLRLDNEPLLRGESCDEKCTEHCLSWLQHPAERSEQ